MTYCTAELKTSQTNHDESKKFIDFSDQTATPQKLVEMSCGFNGHPMTDKPQGSSSDPETKISKNIAQLFFLTFQAERFDCEHSTKKTQKA